MLTSLCLSARIHSQMRLNTHTYHCHHPQLPWLQCVMDRNFLLSVSVFAPLPLFPPLFCPLSPFPSFVQSLSVSVMMNQGEAVIGTAP